MEENPVFDCGRGSVLTSAGEVEMDAMIMEGSTLGTGAVAAVSGVLHPVTLARQVMQKTPHILLVGPGARAFADEMGHPVEPTDQLVTPAAKAEYDGYKRTSYQQPVDDLFNA
jgi:beta-aspartyl-peptidase (threonine type)